MRAKGYLLLVAMLWFGNRIISSLYDHAVFVESVYYWVRAGLFYTVLITDWFFVLKNRLRPDRSSTT